MRVASVVVGSMLALGLAEATHASPRVASLDQCADQYVLALSPRSRIAGLSPRAQADDSFLRLQARGLPVVRADTEALLGVHPQVVVRSWGGSPGLLNDLKRRDVQIITLEDAPDFSGVRANIRRVARTLDQTATGERLVRVMDRQLASSAGAWRGRPALYLTSGGGTTGRGTLIDAILRAAGLRNAQQGVGFREVSLESLVAQPPEAIVGGFFDRALVARQPWGVGRHGVLKALMRKRALVSLPADRLGCPAWFSADAVAAIADAAPGKLGR